MQFLKRLHAALSPAAMLVAILALVVAAGGAGYAAGQIGTSGIKNKAITTKKIKNGAVTGAKIKANAVNGSKVANGTLAAADLVKDGTYHALALSNGGEGDCVWNPGSLIFPELGRPSYRVDRFGTVHLNGIALPSSAAGGDGTCNPGDAGQDSDGIATILPPGARPKTLQVHIVDGNTMFIGGKTSANLGGFVLPAGAIYFPTSSTPLLLDGMVFDAAAGPGATAPRTVHRGTNPGLASKYFGLKSQ